MQSLADGASYLWQVYLNNQQIFQVVNRFLRPNYIFPNPERNCFAIEWSYSYDIYRSFNTTFDFSGKMISQCGDYKNEYVRN